MNNFDERDRLSRELRARSEAMGGHPIGMDQVRRTARRIVWRRRIATGAVAAAVLAVAVPAGMAATGGVDRGIGPVGHPTRSVTHTAPSPTPSPSPSPTPSPTPAPTPTWPAGAIPLTTAGLAQGAAPTIVYLQGATLHNGDVSEQLPAAYSEIAPNQGGWVALSKHNGEYSLVQLDTTNHVIGTPAPSAPGIAVDLANRTAWFEAGAPGQPGRLVQSIGMAQGQDSLTVPPDVTAHPVGYVRNGLVFATDGVHPQVAITDFAPGTAEVWLKGAIAAGGASEAADLISVQLQSAGTGSCWAVVDPGWTDMDPAGHERWHTCDYALGQFSPDGKYVVGTDAYGDGLGPSWVAILDARTGHEVARFQRPPGSDLFIGQLAWEDESHLLASVHENGSWQIVRMETSGHLEAASPAVPGDETTSPFAFSARP